MVMVTSMRSSAIITTATDFGEIRMVYSWIAGSVRENSYGISLGDLDSDGDLDLFTADYYSNRVWLNQNAPVGLVVTSLVPKNTGFVAQLSAELDEDVLNLGDTGTSAHGPPDVVLTGTTTGSVPGSFGGWRRRPLAHLHRNGRTACG